MGWYIFGLIVALIIQGIMADKFASIAEEKGHYRSSYFWLCFLLGVAGYCMVAALPDLVLHSEINNLNKANSDISKTVHTNTSTHNNDITSASLEKPSSGNWICKNCGTSNNLNYGQCKKCGKFRS